MKNVYHVAKIHEQKDLSDRDKYFKVIVALNDYCADNAAHVLQLNFGSASKRILKVGDVSHEN